MDWIGYKSVEIQFLFSVVLETNLLTMNTKPQGVEEKPDYLGSAAIQFALELGRVKSMPDMPSMFYEAVEKSFVKYAKVVLLQEIKTAKEEQLHELYHQRKCDKMTQQEFNAHREELLDYATSNGLTL